VLLREQKVFVHLGAKEDREAAAWVQDTGATHHMTSSRAAFQDLDAMVYETVRFEDDSEARIEGRDTMVFFCKSGGRRSFLGVYY
jgi:hypothetical protein